MPPMQSLDTVEIVGRGVVRSEGVVVDKDGYAYGGGRDGVIYRVDPEGTAQAIVRLPKESRPNGLTLDRNGDIVFCDLGLMAMMRVTLSGEVSMICDQAEGMRLTLPNFPVFGADGDLYVSNTVSVPASEMTPEWMRPDAPGGALIRIRPNGRADIVARPVIWANGLAIDPAEEAVYVIRTMLRDCLRIPIRADGSHGEPEVYVRDLPGNGDGIAFAADGSLYVTLPGVAAAEGAEPARFSQIVRAPPGGGVAEVVISDPERRKLRACTNCAFGGPGLRQFYMANLEADHMCRTDLGVAGHPLYHQR